MENNSSSFPYLLPPCWSWIPLLHVAWSPWWGDSGAEDEGSYLTACLWARLDLGWRHLHLSAYMPPGVLDPTGVKRELLALAEV